MSAEILLDEYSRWVLGDSFALNTNRELKDKVRQSALEDSELHNSLHNDAFSLIASGLQNKTDLLSALKELAGAFQTLEQAALQLYFTPWRKELHTIKMYTGHYVYILESALPQDAIFLALKKLGYEPQEEMCLTLRSLPPSQTLLSTALGFLAAQLECYILSDIVLSLGPALGSGTDLIHERRSWGGVTVCMERLKKLTLKARSAPLPTSSVDIYGSSCKDSDGEAVFYQPQLCGDHKPWDQHANGYCSKVTKHSLHNKSLQPMEDTTDSTKGQPVGSSMHDCVFSQKSLAVRCAQCHTFHSSSCSIIGGCKDMGHQVIQLTTAEKLGAVIEEQEKRHELHFCLQQGHLPHYRCAQCRQLHYIKCEGLLECRRQGHNATMIMLEKDQQLWLQRSLMDLTQLCSEGGT